MKKKVFISKIENTYRIYFSALKTLTYAQMVEPRTCGEWSVKDVVAHITWYESEMVGVLRRHSLVGSDLWNLPLEQRNTVIFAENKDRPIKGILSDSRRIHRLLMKLIQDLSDEDFKDASHFHQMPLSWIPWQVIASNTCEHYPEHAAEIQKVFSK